MTRLLAFLRRLILPLIVTFIAVLGALGVMYASGVRLPGSSLSPTASPTPISPAQAHTDTFSKHIDSLLTKEPYVLNGAIRSVNTSNHSLVAAGNVKGREANYMVEYSTDTPLAIRPTNAIKPYEAFHPDSFIPGESVAVYGSMKDPNTIEASLILVTPLPIPTGLPVHIFAPQASQSSSSGGTQ